MIKKIKAVLIVIVGMCLIIAMLGACAMGSRERSPEQPNNQPQGQNLQQQRLKMENMFDTTRQPGQNQMLGANPENNQGVNPEANQQNQLVPGQQMLPDMQKAKNIKNQLNNMSEVENVNVVVVGDTALVGCKPSGNAKDVNALKNKIVNKVKEIDKSIKNVTVSEKADIMDRIKRLENDVENNIPMDKITNEFNRIIREITPAA